MLLAPAVFLFHLLLPPSKNKNFPNFVCISVIYVTVCILFFSFFLEYPKLREMWRKCAGSACWRSGCKQTWLYQIRHSLWHIHVTLKLPPTTPPLPSMIRKTSPDSIIVGPVFLFYLVITRRHFWRDWYIRGFQTDFRDSVFQCVHVTSLHFFCILREFS